MRLVFTGTHNQAIYRWSAPTHLDYSGWHPTGQVEAVPMKLILNWNKDKESLSFEFWDYDALEEGVESEKFKVIHKGKLERVTPVFEKRKDNSGGLWHNLNFIGQYHSWASKHDELRLQQPQYSDKALFVYAQWPHRRFYIRQNPKEVYTESCIMNLDSASQNALYELWVHGGWDES